MTCKQCGLEKDVRQVALTIKRQIGASTLMEMGAHRFASFAWGEGGLEFKIKYRSNRRGTVDIMLQLNDTYDVSMFDYRHKEIVSRDNIYAGQLSRVLRSGFKKLRGER